MVIELLVSIPVLTLPGREIDERGDDCRTQTHRTGAHMPPPHIALVLADDLPWELFPRRGNDGAIALLPSVKRHLIDDGLTLERHYSFSLCAPARASLLTGRWPHRVYETSSMRACKGVSPGMSTLAEKLKGAGYAAHGGLQVRHTLAGVPLAAALASWVL